MVKKWSVSYPAVNGTEQRRVYVYLPTMYEADPDRRYPVLYMFDGQNVFFDEDATFGKSWGVADYLDYTDTPLIVGAGKFWRFDGYSFRHRCAMPPPSMREALAVR